MRFLGVDIGTGSTKGVLVDGEGRLITSTTRSHATSSPHPGWYEHDAESLWWADVVAVVGEVLQQAPGPVDGVGVSGIGPAVLLTDAADRPVRPAILYGIDTRSQPQIETEIARLGIDALVHHTGNTLTTQAVGPKLAWVAENEPEAWAASRYVYSAPSWVVRKLTGAYVFDRYSASNSDPLFDMVEGTWWEPAWQNLDALVRPELAWPGDVVGEVSVEAARITGLRAGTPVIAGAIDALAEAYSVGVDAPGDTMVMYGSTMFLIQVLAQPIRHHGVWSALGRREGAFAAAAGLATSGLVTNWLTELTGTDYTALIDEAGEVPAGSDGLLLLPYFEGERTPIFDPRARGTWIGLTLRHGRGHLYRSALEGVAHGVRHNLDTMAAASSPAQRLVAVGGGTQARLGLQIVSDVTGLPQDITGLAIGASYGDARMVAGALGVDTKDWNPPVERIEPNPSTREVHDSLHEEYLRLYPLLAPTMHTLATLNR